MKHGLPCILALQLTAQLAAAAWINIGPYGGVARALASDASGTTVYVMNPRSGVFRSSGGPWILVFDAIDYGVTTTGIIVDPQTSRVYAGTSAGLYQSDDGGASWRAINGEAIIAVDAASDRVIISTLNGLLRSADGGATWTRIGSPPTDVLTTVAFLRIDPHDSAHVAAVIAGNLFTSDDFGDSWQKLDATNIVSATFGDVLYAGGSNGVYACRASCDVLSTESVVDVAYWRGRLYWAAPTRLIPNAVVFSLLAMPDALLAGTTAGVFGSDDGLHWTNRSDGLTNVRISALAIAASSLYAATRGQGLLQRDSIWSDASSGLPAHPPALPIADALASDGSVLYAAFSGDGLYRSTDLGVTWNDISQALPSRDIIDIAASPAIVIVTTAAGTVQSNDRGVTWQRDTAFDAIGPIEHIAIAGSQIYAASDRGIFVKTAAAWRGPLFAAAHINALAAVGNRLFAAVASGIYFTDSGSNWLFVNGSDALPNDISALASDGVFLYAGTNGGSVFATSLATRHRVIRPTE